MRLVLTPAVPAEPPVASSGDLPWALPDVQRLIRITLATLFVVLACFAGARNTAVWDDQLYWLVGAIAAMLVASYSWTLWILTGARALRIRQRALDVTARELIAVLRPAAVVGGDVDVQVIGTFLTAPGMTRYHRAGCQLIRGRATHVVQAGVGDLEPCGMCLP